MLISPSEEVVAGEALAAGNFWEDRMTTEKGFENGKMKDKKNAEDWYLQGTFEMEHLESWLKVG